MTTQATPSITRRHGPSALGTSLHRFLELTFTLARTEFKLRYFGSLLGYFWQLARPLLFFGVIYVFFTQILDVSNGTPHYGVYLLTGIVLWTFFAEATGNAVSCLVQRESLLRKIRFPRLAVPLSATLTSTFNLAMNSIAVIVFALANGLTPTLGWLWLLPVALGYVVFAGGIGLILSSLYVRFRDVQPIWDVVSQVLFYATPIMYVATKYQGLEHVALLNPLAFMMTQMGHAFVYPGKLIVPQQIPHFVTVTTHVGGVLVRHQASYVTTVYQTQYPMRSAYVASGGLAHTIASIAVIPAVFVFGLWLFMREAPHVAENL